MKGSYFSVWGEKIQTEAVEVSNQELSINSVRTGVHSLRIQEPVAPVKRLQV